LSGKRLPLKQSLTLALFNLFKLSLSSLISNVGLCSCVTCCCYKLLENPTISHMKSKSTRDAIIHVLGIMVKKYNHMLGGFICTSHTHEWVCNVVDVEMLSVLS